MKYIISERKFDHVIMTYLDGVLDGIEEEYYDIGGGFYHYYKLGDKEIFGIEKDGERLGISISQKFVHSVSDFFGISYNEAQDYILKWVEINLGLNLDFFEDLEDL